MFFMLPAMWIPFLSPTQTAADAPHFNKHVAPSYFHTSPYCEREPARRHITARDEQDNVLFAAVSRTNPNSSFYNAFRRLNPKPLLTRPTSLPFSPSLSCPSCNPVPFPLRSPLCALAALREIPKFRLRRRTRQPGQDSPAPPKVEKSPAPFLPIVAKPVGVILSGERFRRSLSAPRTGCRKGVCRFRDGRGVRCGCLVRPPALGRGRRSDRRVGWSKDGGQ